MFNINKFNNFKNKVNSNYDVEVVYILGEKYIFNIKDCDELCKSDWDGFFESNEVVNERIESGELVGVKMDYCFGEDDVLCVVVDSLENIDSELEEYLEKYVGYNRGLEEGY